MKKIILSIISIFIIIAILVVDNSKVINKEDNNKIKVNNNLLSMMLETEANSGQYEMTTSSSWPTDGYVFNNELSKCENGSTLSWDEENKKIVMEGNTSDKCYVYFDVYINLEYHKSCDDNSVACYIAKKYTGTQGTDGLYYHNSDLTNGAEDNSYRYSGNSVKNYICLESSAKKCPDDNLYRIVGVFDENNHGIAGENLVKVIKSTSYGSYAWNSNDSSDWTSSPLNSTLNSTFLTEGISSLSDNIVNVLWKVSGYNSADVTPKTLFDAEITNATKTYSSKIGLMYASDYGFATSQDYWKTDLSSYNTNVAKSNWLSLFSTEWFLSPDSTNGGGAYCAYSSGAVSYNVHVTVSKTIRPSFYLSSNVKYESGDGTISNPIRVK